MVSGHPLVKKWQDEAHQLEQRGLKDLATLIRNLAGELKKHEDDYGSVRLTLDEAHRESGYSKDHLALLLSQGRIPNAGKRGAPRIFRRDLPKKPPRQPVMKTSASGPQLVQAALAEQGIPPAET